jgi:XTP/dITP diphosphohydrolase
MTRLLLATTNRGKVREYRSLLGGLPFEMVTPDEAGINIEVEENRPSYEENASIKANAYARASHLITLADDSGLEVDALAGEPGIRSARAAGETAGDVERIEHLLARLKGIPLARRTARFKCVIALATPEGRTQLFHGECPGLIALAPSGENGFGYDPVFYLPGLKKTMAELPLDIKNKISHRGNAVREAYPILEQLAEKVKL